MPKIELSDYLRSDCELKKPNISMLVHIYHVTGGNPCADCNLKHDCKDRHELEILSQRGGSKRSGVPVETNAQIAKRLGISKRQVAKMRKNMEL